MACIGESGKGSVMVEYEDDDPTVYDEGPTVVTRTIYEAAKRFEKTLGPGAPGAIGEAQARMDKYHEAGNTRSAARWGKIYAYLMDRASSGTGKKLVILKPGETWDAEEEKVIKPHARRQRSGKGGR
jgi:hypothetical protein